jgi:hypothetical protein
MPPLAVVENLDVLEERRVGLVGQQISVAVVPAPGAEETWSRDHHEIHRADQRVLALGRGIARDAALSDAALVRAIVVHATVETELLAKAAQEIGAIRGVEP